MNNDILNISLNQGKKYKNYQNKIKKTDYKSSVYRRKNIKEYFTNGLEIENMLRQNNEDIASVLERQNTRMNLENRNNQKDLEELNQLQTKYNDLLQQYNSIQKSIGNSSLDTINRLSSKNPYLGKNIRFTNGTICYVTNQGIAKPYTNLDVYNNTIGKNGCPKEVIDLNIAWLSEYMKGSQIPTNPILIVGSEMKQGESCGYEGVNVYTISLVSNPNSSYIGCYNDLPASTSVNAVPVMNSSNNVNGFQSGASSIYLGNNSSVGPWCAFDQNPGTVWHSEVSSSTNYNATTGIYEGSNSINIVNTGIISGEFLQINMPGINTSSSQNITINQYSIAPRLDAITTRSPNSWYILGYKDNQWFQVDRQQNQSFTNGTPKVYSIYNPGSYSAYILLIDKVGNDDQTTNRYCVQVAEWNLFMNAPINNSDRAMILNSNIINYTTFDKCQDYAVNNGYTYFGMQDLQPDGNALCLVSNDILRTQVYGDAQKQNNSIPVWSTNTAGSGATNCFVNDDGSIILKDASGNIYWQSPNPPSDCILGGKINQDSLTATYGANCNDKGFNVTSGNATESVKKMLNANNNANELMITINNSLFGDPANGCPKSWDTAYQCGNAWKSAHIDYAEGQNFIYDCKEQSNNCNFFFYLQSDGNLCLYRGIDPSNNKDSVAIWCTGTVGKQMQPNPDWLAKNGKYGRNYLKMNESLGPNEWIGSDNGSLKLIMQSDGNLVLYTSQTKLGCSVVNQKTYGSSGINAVYKLDATGNRASLGKMAYIDSESNLKEYPDDMLGYSNDYQIFQNTDSVGNDITSLITSDQNGCLTACNGNVNCAAFVYQGKSQTCWLKNSSAFPRGEKQPNDGVILGVRKPQINVKGPTCSNKIVEIDTIQYDNYVKGNAMTNDEQCNIPIVSQEDQIKYDNIKSQLLTLGQDITDKMENLYNQDNKVYEKLNMNSEEFKKSLLEYKMITKKIQKDFRGLQNFPSNNIEGMSNLNMNDINGMLSDTDLRVLQGNYSYFMWSILAVGILTITINTMKK
jgi:hypothetical protein